MFKPLILVVKKTKTLVICACALTIGTIYVTTAQAQQSLGIAAVVNDEMISIYDLNSRLAAVVAFAGIPNTPETRRRIAPQVLRSLIDERIKLQEANLLQISSNPRDISDEKADLERQNGMKPGQLKEFIKQRGLQGATIDSQMESRSLWKRMVSTIFTRGIIITDDEITETFEKLKSNKGKPEDLVFEIFLPISQPEQEKDVSRLAERLIQQIRDGSNFSAIAQNFSQSSSAGNGGNLGWTLRGQHDAELNQIISTLRPGQIAGPLRTQDGIYIVLLKATRKSRGLDGPPAGPEKVKLYQLHLALPKNPAAQLIAQQMQLAQSETRSLNGCVNMDKVAKKIGSPLSGELGTFEISKISPQMQSLVKNVSTGQASAPQQIPEGVIVLMVCDRIVPKIKKRTPEQQRQSIQRQLLTERLNLAATRYIRDLRRASFIDVRLGNQ